MTTSLQPCPSCARHIRVDEERCPFCSTFVAGQLVAASPRPRGRLSRAALVAASALVATPLVGCGGSTESDGGKKGSGGEPSASGGADGTGATGNDGSGGEVSEQPVYGAPATGGVSAGSGGDGGGGDMVGPVYGVPPTDS